MYRVKILALMVIVIGVGMALFQYFNIPLETEYYSRVLSKAVTNLQREFGNAGLAGIVFAAGIFGFLLYQRRT